MRWIYLIAFVGGWAWFFHFSPWAQDCFARGGNDFFPGDCKKISVESK